MNKHCILDFLKKFPFVIEESAKGRPLHFNLKGHGLNSPKINSTLIVYM